MNSAHPGLNASSENRSNPLLLGCLGGIALLVCLLAAGLIWVFVYAKGHLAGMASEALVAAIEEANLEEDQQIALRHEIERLEAGIRSDEVSMGEIGKLVEAVTKSPLGPIFGLFAIESQAARDGIPEEELAAMERVTRRAVHGLIEGKIEAGTLERAFRKISRHPDEDGEDMQFDLYEDITADELRAYFAELSAIVDEAGVMADPPSPDLAGLLRATIEASLGRVLPEPSADVTED